MRLGGRTVLITGASSGVGAATADRLAGVGARLVLLGRDTERLEGVARRTGGRALPADLASPEGLARACEAVSDVDVLVNNAGRGFAGRLASMPPGGVSELVTVNLSAPMRLTQAAVPGMRARGTGHVVLVSSIAAVGVAEEAAYAATKAGLRAFAASLRGELSGDGIGVTTVLPGAVATAFFTGRGRPYDRRLPRPVRAETVAQRLVRAVQDDRAEVFVPAWLTVAARVQGALPGTFERLSRTFG